MENPTGLDVLWTAIAGLIGSVLIGMFFVLALLAVLMPFYVHQTAVWTKKCYEELRRLRQASEPTNADSPETRPVRKPKPAQPASIHGHLRKS